jgi:hypothetical protein
MDTAEQKDGEARVRDVLVKGLQRQGLAKPSTLTKDQFAEMIDEVCQRLAYMSPQNLAALAEEAVTFATGKDKDRFPLATTLLKRAREIQPPKDTGSPLIRAVFANAKGQAAIAEGWAPELRKWLRANRLWPNDYVCKQLSEEADGPRRHLRDIERRLTRGEDLTPAEAAFRDRRLLAVRACEALAQLGAVGEGGA